VYDAVVLYMTISFILYDIMSIIEAYLGVYYMGDVDRDLSARHIIPKGSGVMEN